MGARTGIGRWVWLLGIGGWLSCAPVFTLAPAPGAQRVPGQAQAAEQHVQGINLRVNGAAWPGSPTVQELLTPLQLSIANSSGRSLRLRYDAFALAGPTGFRLTPLPPYQVISQAPSEVINPSFYYDHFFVAPPYSRHYFGVPPWAGPFPYDPLYYPNFYGYWPYTLPTREILQQAIPEGVVEDGGRVTGFLYFQRLNRSWTEVSFQAELVDAKSGESFGKISIPLQFGQFR
jgi:hypothetical protein